LTQILRREKHRITHHYSAGYKQPNKLSQLQNTQLKLLTVTGFPCHFKVSRDKLALTNRRWMCKKKEKIDDYRQLLGAKFRQWEKNPARWRILKSWTGHVRIISQSNLGI